MNDLAVNLHTQGRLDEAEAAYGQAIAVGPRLAIAHYNLGRLFQDTGRMAAAEAAYGRAIAIQPEHVLAHYNRAMVLEELMKFDEAEAMYRRALALDPGLAAAANNLGALLQGLGRVDEAETEYRRILSIWPEHGPALNNLAAVLRNRGEIDEAIVLYDRAMALEPRDALAMGERISCEMYRSSVTLKSLADLHAEWDRRHAAPLESTWKPAANERDPDRRLRLGFVSSDLGRHPVGYFLVRVLEALDRSESAVYCYSSRLKEDDLSDRFRTASDVWRRVRYCSDERLANVIRDDRIDILFDLAGQTDGGRPLLFARKPAPIQIAWIGYESTTGMRAMDYLIADRHMVPESAEPYYREKILRMPDAYLCYDPPCDAPPVGPLPAASAGRVTFSSFNNPAKIGPEVVEVWAEILRRVPGSRLVMKYRGLGGARIRRGYLDRFAAFGLDAERLTFLPHVPYAQHLAGYATVDIALDPFPFAGTATTCESLWMGAPVVTWPGETFAGRDGLSVLATIGLAGEFVACDVAQYIELAVRWANDLPRLAEIRASLRDRMAGAPLCDAPRFAAALQERLRSIWRRWVHSP